MDTTLLPASDDYPTQFNDRVRAELLRLRLARRLSAYALAIPGKLSAQTIRNIETGRHSPSLKTLALIAQRLGTTAEEIVLAAVRR